MPWRNGAPTQLDTFYNANGYMPALKPKEKEPVAEVHWFEKRQAVSVTLENSYDDWCLAQLAVAAGKPDDRQLFLKRAANVTFIIKKFIWLVINSNGCVTS